MLATTRRASTAVIERSTTQPVQPHRSRNSLPSSIRLESGLPCIPAEKESTNCPIELTDKPNDAPGSDVAGPQIVPVAPMVVEDVTINTTQPVAAADGSVPTRSQFAGSTTATRPTNNESDDDDVTIVSVRNLPGAVNRRPGPVRIKQEPGTGPAKRITNPNARHLQPKPRSRPSQAAPKRPNVIFNPQPTASHGAESSPDVTNLFASSPASSELAPAAAPQSMSSLHSEMLEVESMLHLLPQDPPDGDLPPAYSPPTKSLEQIIKEQNAALEERIYKRIARDLKTGSKRGRTTLSAEEALANLKQASAEYAKAKTAEDRRTTKRGKRNGGDDDLYGSGKGSSQDQRDKDLDKGNGSGSGKKGAYGV